MMAWLENNKKHPLKQTKIWIHMMLIIQRDIENNEDICIMEFSLSV
jgi:hypothetical protein